MSYAASTVQRRSPGKLVRDCVLAVLLLAGCRNVLGVTGYGLLPSDAGATAYVSKYDGTSYRAAACGKCMDESCSDQIRQCSSNPECSKLSQCLAGCLADDSACRVKCNLSWRRTTPMSALMVCAAQQCSECAAAHATYGGADCERCLEKNDEYSAALGRLSRNFAALELDSCQQDCPPAYRERCKCNDIFALSGSGTTSATAGVACVDAGNGAEQSRLQGPGVSDGGQAADILDELDAATKDPACGQACGQNTQDWSCLGQEQPADVLSQESALELHIGFGDVLQVNPIEGVLVRACPGVDGLCDSMPKPGDQVPTDRDGFASLCLHRQAGPGALPFFGAIEATWDQANSIGASSALLYFYPYPSRSSSWILRRLVSRGIANSIVNSVLNRDPDWNSHGGVVWSAVTCAGLPAQDVTAELAGEQDPSLDPREKNAYYTNGSWQLEPSLDATSSSGLGAFVEVLPGQKTLTLRRASEPDPTKNLIGIYTLYVRAGTITTVSLRPYKASN